MLRKLQCLASLKRKDKKGQAIIELAFGTMLVGALLTTMFDFSLVITSKTETLMMARNGVRYMIMQGLSTNQNENEANRVKTESAVKGIYDLNHARRSKYVSLTKVEALQPKNPTLIKNSQTGQNPVYVEVCEGVHPIGPILRGTINVCSAYSGFHSSQSKKK